MKKLLYGLAAISLLFNACGTSKKLEDKEVVEVDSKDYWTPEKILKHNFEYKTFQGKADVSYKDAKQDQSASLNLRMEKDNKIWASVIAMGIAEVGRALITPEHLQGMFRLGKMAVDVSFEEGVRKINAPISFSHLEDLLVGNPMIQKGKAKNIRQEEAITIFELTQDDYLQTIFFNQNTKHINRITVSNKTLDFTANIALDDYINLGFNQVFALYKKIDIQTSEGPIEIRMRFKNQDIDIPIETPYSVPSSYKIQSSL